MFDEKCYQDLRSSKYFRGFSRNCFIGFIATYVIAFSIASGIMFSFSMFPDTADAKINSFAILLTFIVGLAVVVFSIWKNLYNRKPYLCMEGTIVEVNGKKATVAVKDMKYTAISFEHFLRNSDLSEYKINDRVIIYAGDKKATRPMFYHVH